MKSDFTVTLGIFISSSTESTQPVLLVATSRTLKLPALLNCTTGSLTLLVVGLPFVKDQSYVMVWPPPANVVLVNWMEIGGLQTLGGCATNEGFTPWVT
jgi:hypothetical protein